MCVYIYILYIFIYNEETLEPILWGTNPQWTLKSGTMYGLITPISCTIDPIDGIYIDF